MNKKDNDFKVYLLNTQSCNICTRKDKSVFSAICLRCYESNNKRYFNVSNANLNTAIKEAIS